ncbi:hypothetical protein D6C99_09817 [Aureobasidium pullulans]|uniref:Uncharacterized protein n=1 Tax=Aureobasidium pullulans TaxID=5580 RepID=A0A4S9ARQ5_AURPU|nr:hypothetical protein D6D15_10162 [Aureobasidium pullulans]THY37240.1 hypothetical protein D6C99_09817 [Aureobasidium pullulans]
MRNTPVVPLSSYSVLASPTTVKLTDGYMVEDRLLQKSYISCPDALTEIEMEIYELLEKEFIYPPAVAQINAGSGFIDLTNDDEMDIFESPPAVGQANTRDHHGGTSCFMDLTSDDEMDTDANVPESARSESRTLSPEPRLVSNRLDVQLVLEPYNASNNLEVGFDYGGLVEDLYDYFDEGVPPPVEVSSILNEAMSELEGQPMTELDSPEYLEWEY